MQIEKKWNKIYDNERTNQIPRPQNSLKTQPKTNDCQICIKSILHVPSWMLNLHSFIIIIIRINDAVFRFVVP